MSKTAQAVLNEIEALPRAEQRELWQELGRRLGEDSKEPAELEKALLDGVNSGSPIPFTKGDWQRLRDGVQSGPKKP